MVHTNMNMRRVLTSCILAFGSFLSFSDGQVIPEIPVISSLPQNATIVKGGNVLLDCPVKSEYTQSFTWKFFGATVAGQQIYSTPPYSPSTDPKFSPTRFQKVGAFGLNISQLQWQDGGTYQCNFVYGDASGLSDIIVIDTVDARIDRDTVDVGDEVTLTCSVTFGAPINDSLHVTPDQFPQLEMTYAGDIFGASRAPVVYTAGQPGVKQHVISRTTKLTVQSPETVQRLRCSVYTVNPQFISDVEATLYVKVPAYNVRVTPERWEHTVNDVINCSADGVPAPTYTWERVESKSTVVSINGPLLTITGDMVGNNTWRCKAENYLNSEPAVYVFSFNVYGGTDSVVGPATAGSSVGLAIGLTIGIAGAILLTVLLVLCIVKRRNRAGQVKKEKKSQPRDQEMMPMQNDVQGFEDTLSDIKPVPKPRTMSPNSTVDSSAVGSGYPDMVGFGMMRAAGSMESLNRSLDESEPGGRTRPKERMRQRNPRGSTESLDKSFDKPRPTERSRMNGSNESLDQIGADGKPKPKDRPRNVEFTDTKPLLKDRPQTDFRGSNESLDRLQPTAKPRPNLRASQESLDKLASGGKAAPPTAPKPKSSGTLSNDSSVV